VFDRDGTLQSSFRDDLALTVWAGYRRATIWNKVNLEGTRMALINGDVCGHQVSKNAPRCISSCTAENDDTTASIRLITLKTLRDLNYEGDILLLWSRSISRMITSFALHETKWKSRAMRSAELEP